ncbi:CBS domain-containing protein [Halosimplex carlsbadense 2-9-1]|uniref:CBS domain-containing protein n=1 Tax=Halosimplex carlsbadense 2-9-1 TaxID=797114 RepID=M0CDH8_9EURY|nr:CBS domain-containing protein [Halosimplex carlsbadense]ELZ19924.1 CBS domain-containing protein [Halosimplex carlsbadense 2-9-1]
MDISEAVTTDYREFDPETPVSKLLGAFQTHRDPAVVVTDDGGIVGVVTRKALVSSRHDPDEKARSVMREDVPSVDRRDDVREVARRMVESEFPLVPVYDGEVFEGVATDESVAAATEPFLDALDVSDVYTRDLRAVDPETTVGEVIHRLRVDGISRVPVVDDGDAVGMVSYFDLLEFAVRETDRQQGGSVGGFGRGGASSTDAERADQGYGERAGVGHRLLDIPARDVMNEPVATTGPTAGLDDAVGRMREDDYSSLVVEVPAEGVDGVVTLTDVLRSLTWTPDDGTRLQVFGARYLTTTTREEVSDLIDGVARKFDEMHVIEAYVVLHKHKERQRGSPLIRATIRLFTDRGRFSGTGEEYGDAPAIRSARDHLERAVLDEKSRTMGERRGQRSPEDAERLLGWWLEA